MDMTTIGMLIFIGIILIILLVKDWILDKYYLYRMTRECDIVVKSRHTEREYHVSEYRISNTKGMELKIYNPYGYGYEWFSVWRFHGPREIMRRVDKDYYNEPYSKYRGSENLKDFTDSDKI